MARADDGWGAFAPHSQVTRTVTGPGSGAGPSPARTTELTDSADSEVAQARPPGWTRHQGVRIEAGCMAPRISLSESRNLGIRFASFRGIRAPSRAGPIGPAVLNRGPGNLPARAVQAARGRLGAMAGLDSGSDACCPGPLMAPIHPSPRRVGPNPSDGPGAVQVAADLRVPPRGGRPGPV